MPSGATRDGYRSQVGRTVRLDCSTHPTSHQGASHPPRHRGRVAAAQVAVARQRPEREEFRIAVVAQVENPREAGRGVARLVPEAVLTLGADEIVDAALHGGA